MGAAVGESGIPARLLQGLHDREAIEKEINEYCTAVFGSAEDSAAKSEL